MVPRLTNAISVGTSPSTSTSALIAGRSSVNSTTTKGSIIVSHISNGERKYWVSDDVNDADHETKKGIGQDSVGRIALVVVLVVVGCVP